MTTPLKVLPSLQLGSSFASQIIPPLSSRAHKGSHGRLGLVGGSLMYTGAPYYAAMSGLRSGADLVYICTDSRVSSVLHAYSPELIVIPGLERQDQQNRLQELQRIFAHGRVNGAWIFGPGLGDDSFLLNNAFSMLMQIGSSKAPCAPLVIDADGLRIFRPESGLDYAALLAQYAPVVLTPNAHEFKRLLHDHRLASADPEDPATLEALALRIGNIGIVVKGALDRIYYQAHYCECSVEGALRRVGGQGDVLTGVLATFLTWAKLAASAGALQEPAPHILAAMWSACSLTRHAARLAFLAHGRAMSATDLIGYIGSSFRTLFTDTT